MGCFLGCFRIKDEGSGRCFLLSKLYSWKKRELVADRNSYAGISSSEERGTPSEKAGLKSLEENFDGNDSIQLKLKKEAKFLKSCGAILETPIEIRKASAQQSLTSDPDCININWDQQHENSHGFHIKDSETLSVEEHKLKSSQHKENDHTTKKMVRFDEWHTTADVVDIYPQSEDQMLPHVSNSPYPTPLNLGDDLRTPGTVYPLKPENFRTGRIRAQFAYPVPALSQQLFDQKAFCEDRQITQKLPPVSASLNTEPDEEDIPIKEGAADHWNSENHSGISPKQWHGNGIPNSTTKYKEDQKVNWHATPFEVRLQKALSDDNVYPPRSLEDYS